MEKNINKDKNSENVPLLQITEVALVHCNLVNNDYQQNLRILYTFAPNNLFGQLLEISSTNWMFSKTFNSVFTYWRLVTNQNSKPLEIENKVNLILISN